MTIKVTLSRPPAAVEFEVGSVAEAVGVLQQEESALVQLFTLCDGMTSGGDEGTEQAEPDAAAPPKTRKPRTPKVEAVAPAPMPVPAAPTLDDGIPANLRRDPVTNTAPTMAAPPAPVAAAPAPPPPPPLPNAPPIAPAAPVNVLATKVVAELERRASASADKGAALAAWLASAGVVKAGVTYGEAVAAVALATDVQLCPVARGLGVS